MAPATPPRQDPTHFVQYGGVVRAQRGRTPTFALRTGGGYVFASGTPQREQELEDHVKSLETHIQDLTLERNSLLLDLKSAETREGNERKGRAAALGQVEYHVEQFRTLEQKYENSLASHQADKQDHKDAMREAEARWAEEKDLLQAQVEKMGRECEELGRQMREAEKMAEVREGGLKDLCSALRAEKQDCLNQQELLSNDKAKLTCHIDQAHARAGVAEKRNGELEHKIVLIDQRAIELENRLQLEQERVTALTRQLENGAEVARQLAECEGRETALQADHRGVSSALALATQELAELRTSQADCKQREDSACNLADNMTLKAKQLADKNDELTRALEECQQSLKDTQEKHQRALQSYQDSNKAHNETSGLLSHVEVRADSLARQMAAEQAEVAKLTSSLAGQVSANEELQERFDQYTADKTAEIKGLKEKVTELTISWEGEKGTVTALRATIADLERQVSERLTEVSVERKARNSLAVRASDSERDLAAKVATTEEMAVNLQEARQLLSSGRSKIADLEDEVKSAWDECEKLKSAVRSKEMTIEELQAKLTSTEEELQLGRDSLMEEERRATETHKALVRVDLEANHQRAELQRLTEDLGAERQRAETLSLLLQNERQEMDMQRKASQQAMDDHAMLQQQLKDYKIWASASPISHNNRIEAPPAQ